MVLVIIGRPLADLNVGEADVDPFAVRRRNYGDFSGLSVQFMGPSGPVDHVEGRDQIDAFESVRLEAHA